MKKKLTLNLKGTWHDKILSTKEKMQVRQAVKQALVKYGMANSPPPINTLLVSITLEQLKDMDPKWSEITMSQFSIKRWKAHRCLYDSIRSFLKQSNSSKPPTKKTAPTTSTVEVASEVESSTISCSNSDVDESQVDTASFGDES